MHLMDQFRSDNQWGNQHGWGLVHKISPEGDLDRFGTVGLSKERLEQNMCRKKNGYVVFILVFRPQQVQRTKG